MMDGLARMAVVRAATLAVAVCALAACAADPRTGASRAVDPVADPVAGASLRSGAAATDLRVGALEPREPSPGECGLFLWRLADTQSLSFFYNSTTGRAAINIDGVERELRRLHVISSPTGSRHGEQVFATPGGAISVRVVIHEREDVRDGVRIRRAVIRVADDRGWSVVLGAGGLAACQP